MMRSRVGAGRRVVAGFASGARLAIGILAAASILASACDTRQHENPLDPDNPGTHGVPRALAAIAGDHAVELRIDPIGLSDLAGFRLARSTGGGAPAVVGDSLLAPSTRVVEDSSVTNGATYQYTLELVTRGADGGVGDAFPAAPDTATPGPDEPWVIDDGAPPLVELSADLRRARARFGAGGPYADIAVDPSDGTVWAADEYDARLWHFDRDGSVILVRDDLAPLFRLAAGGADGTLWALSRETRVLYRLNAAAEVLDSASVPDAGTLRDLDTDPSDGSAWVTDALGAVWQFVPGMEPVPVVTSGSSSSFAIAFDPDGRGFWLSHPNTGELDFWERLPVWHELVVPAGVAIPREVAPRVGPGGEVQAWVVDLTGSLALVEPTGVIARTAAIASPLAPLAAPDGSCYVIEGGTGSILHVSAAGAIDHRLATLLAPRALAIWRP